MRGGIGAEWLSAFGRRLEAAERRESRGKRTLTAQCHSFQMRRSIFFLALAAFLAAGLSVEPLRAIPLYVLGVLASVLDIHWGGYSRRYVVTGIVRIRPFPWLPSEILATTVGSLLLLIACTGEISMWRTWVEANERPRHLTVEPLTTEYGRLFEGFGGAGLRFRTENGKYLSLKCPYPPRILKQHPDTSYCVPNMAEQIGKRVEITHGSVQDGGVIYKPTTIYDLKVNGRSFFDHTKVSRFTQRWLTEAQVHPWWMILATPLLVLSLAGFLPNHRSNETT